MSELPTSPPTDVTVTGNVNDRNSTVRTDGYRFQVRAHAKDSGLILYDVHGGWINMNLASVKRLAAFFTDWARYQASRFRPTGFVLVNILTGENHEVKEGLAARFVGDSFYIVNENGEQVGPAHPAEEWELRPLYANAPTAEVVE